MKSAKFVRMSDTTRLRQTSQAWQRDVYITPENEMKVIDDIVKHVRHEFKDQPIIVKMNKNYFDQDKNRFYRVMRYGMQLISDELYHNRFEGIKFMIEAMFELLSEVGDFDMMKWVCELWVNFATYWNDWKWVVWGLSLLKDVYM